MFCGSFINNCFGSGPKQTKDMMYMKNQQSLAPAATVLGGQQLSCRCLVDLARSGGPVDVDDAAADLVSQSWKAIENVAGRRAVYGRTTGVGANRNISVDGPRGDKDVNLLRSHATGSGPWLPATTVRAAVLVRLNQLLRGGSGMHPDIVGALVSSLNSGRLAKVRSFGAIGTGDLSAFGEIALGLMGEAELADGSTDPSWQPHQGDALPFISTNAMTIARAALLTGILQEWLATYERVAAISLLAVRGSLEAYAPEVHQARPHAGQVAVAGDMTALLADQQWDSKRVQDSYGFRAMPQVAGALSHALSMLTGVLEVELNAAAENPYVSIGSQDIFHNANFHTLELALAVDHAKLALSSVAHLSLARLNDLSNPEMTGLGPFLSAGEPGSSGTMLLEYNAAAALARLRSAAQPASLGSVVISRGTEDHASFSTQAVEQLGQCIEAATAVLACEMLASVRALILQEREPAPDTVLGRYFAQARGLLASEDPRDRTLGNDLAQAIQHIHLLTGFEA